MQTCSRHRAIFAIGKDEEKAIRRQRNGRKRPFFRLVRLVGEMPACKIYRRSAGIVQLEPVGVIPIFVGNDILPRSHELRDDNRRGGLAKTNRNPLNKNEKSQEEQKELFPENQGRILKHAAENELADFKSNKRIFVSNFRPNCRS